MKDTSVKPLGLDMDFNEALARLSRVKPEEIENLKQKKRPPKRPLGGEDVPEGGD